MDRRRTAADGRHQKLKRRELKRWAESGITGAPQQPARADASVAAIVGYLARRDVASDTTLEELGVSSLERVELMIELEERFDITIDETAFSNARTVHDLEALVQQGEPAGRPAPATESGAAPAR